MKTKLPLGILLALITLIILPVAYLKITGKPICKDQLKFLLNPPETLTSVYRNFTIRGSYTENYSFDTVLTVDPIDFKKDVYVIRKSRQKCGVWTYYDSTKKLLATREYNACTGSVNTELKVPLESDVLEWGKYDSVYVVPAPPLVKTTPKTEVPLPAPPSDIDLPKEKKE